MFFQKGETYWISNKLCLLPQLCYWNVQQFYPLSTCGLSQSRPLVTGISGPIVRPASNFRLDNSSLTYLFSIHHPHPRFPAPQQNGDPRQEPLKTGSYPRLWRIGQMELETYFYIPLHTLWVVWQELHLPTWLSHYVFPGIHLGWVDLGAQANLFYFSNPPCCGTESTTPDNHGTCR